MDTSTSCNSTSTSAPVKLDLRLLDRCSLSALTPLAYELLSCRFGRFRLHTSLRLRALIRSWQGVYVCKFRRTRTRFQFKKTLPGEHSPENFCCVGPYFQACMNLADVFCLRCFSEARKKHFRRNFRKCSRMRAIVVFSGIKKHHSPLWNQKHSSLLWNQKTSLSSLESKNIALLLEQQQLQDELPLKKKT